MLATILAYKLPIYVEFRHYSLCLPEIDEVILIPRTYNLYEVQEKSKKNIDVCATCPKIGSVGLKFFLESFLLQQ
jgi:hypothetical protein